MADVSSVLTTLSTALSSLSPTQLTALGNHLTASNEAKAIQILSVMQANPNGASAFIATLAAIPNIPPAVITDVSQAINSLPDTKGFTQYIVNAQIALQTALASENSLEQAGLL